MSTSPIESAATAGVARTWLFVPGNRPDRFSRAARSGTDEVICDLEDAVDSAHKEDARESVATWLCRDGAAWVRINGAGTPWYDDDIGAVLDAPGLRGLIVPKAEDADQLDALGRRIGPGRRIVALVETALGVANAHHLASSQSVLRLAFGSIDFANDIDAEECDESLLLARSTLVLASRTAGRAAPIDGVTVAIRDETTIAAEARRGRALGFGAKLCIHPTQLRPVMAAFTPNRAAVEWARSVLEQAGPGVSTPDGHMVDRPVLRRAQRILHEFTEAGPSA